jgi:hypothetical protein
MPNKTCFVVMGFGTKTDYTKPKTFNLDKTYRNIIKPAALAAGFECVRADEIVHSGDINVPMYEQLLKADVVVADVSTYNSNAFYELGVRHTLRPYTTIIISEDGLTFPFDVGQIAVRKYHHMGEGIDYDEVVRMRNELWLNSNKGTKCEIGFYLRPFRPWSSALFAPPKNVPLNTQWYERTRDVECERTGKD